MSQSARQETTKRPRSDNKEGEDETEHVQQREDWKQQQQVEPPPDKTNKKPRTTTTTPRSVVEELEFNLRIWGVDPNRNLKHRLFWNKMHSTLKQIVEGPARLEDGAATRTVLPAQPILLPEDTVSAIRHVLYQECHDRTGMWNIKDLLHEAYPRLPFGLPILKRTKLKQDPPQFKLRIQYDRAGILPTHKYADPLERFKFERLPVKETFRGQWLGRNDCLHVIFRGLIGHFACHSAACVHCHKNKCLRWNDHTKSYWVKLICMNCGSLYELKTSSTAEKIHQKYKNGFIDGGTFLDKFHAAQREKSPDAGHYLAMISMEAAKDENNSGGGWPTFVAKIESVVPQLKNKSFMETADEKDRLYSKIHIQPNGYQRWFDVRWIEFDSRALAEEALDRFESEG